MKGSTSPRRSRSYRAGTRAGGEDSPPSVNVQFNHQQASVSSNHFVRVKVDSIQRELFKSSVRKMAVEVSSYCNRLCRFCPNTEGTRLGPQKLMEESLFLRILNDLSTIDFDGDFAFHQYNEPLADRIILERLRQARSAIPNAKLLINTNGDYLASTYLEDLSGAGLRRLNVSIYGRNHGVFEDDYILRRMRSLIEKLGLELRMSVNQPVGMAERTAWPSVSDAGRVSRARGDRKRAQL